VFAIWVTVLVWLISSLAATADWVDHTDQVLAAISRLESQAFGEIVAVRGYLISGSDNFLKGYESPEKFERAAASLRGLVRDNPRQQARVAEYRDSWRAWREVADAEIAARRQGLDYASLMRDRAEPLERRMRSTADVMRSDEEHLRIERVSRDAVMRRRTLVATTVLGLALASVLGFFSVQAMRQVAARYERTADDLRTEAAKLAETEGQLRAVLGREQAARRTAEEANRMKDEFLATVSHELRTPLHAITGWFQVLKTQQAEPTPLAERAVQAVERNAALLARVVEDLMDNARILSRKLTLEPQATSLEEAVRGAIDGVNATAAQKRIAIGLTVESPLPPVWGDPARLQQVFWNLLANAVKFTPEEGRVDVNVRTEAGDVVVTITDSGQGITREFLPHVFDRFTQEDSGTTRVFSGLGLGLALVSHLVEAHNGRVEAHSEGAGTGATFVVCIPILSGSTDGRQPA
jgi:signal transduction histidine kinase